MEYDDLFTFGMTLVDDTVTSGVNVSWASDGRQVARCSGSVAVVALRPLESLSKNSFY